jgi:glycyl-tRNA synthetase beta chain
MIMVEDEKLKNNRLNLLKEINDLFRNIADFTKLIGG